MVMHWLSHESPMNVPWMSHLKGPGDTTPPCRAQVTRPLEVAEQIELASQKHLDSANGKMVPGKKTWLEDMLFFFLIESYIYIHITIHLWNYLSM